MWKEVSIPEIYSDGDVKIMKDVSGSPNCRTKTLYYHAFPMDKLEVVKQHGIVHPSHRCLHDEQTDHVYIAAGSTIQFTRQRPSDTGHYLFVVWAECASPTFNTRISIPCWYADSIDTNPPIHGLNLHAFQ